MIKWKFVVVRLSILLILFAGIHFGTGPILNVTLTTVTQWFTGSKLEIEKLNASPFQTRMTAARVQLADPKDPLENLVEFSGAHIQFDRNALLRKKFIVSGGSIDGVQFGSGRLTSGHLDPESTDESQPSLVNDYLANVGGKVADGLTSLLTRRFDENFETVRFSREVIDRWPREYEKLIARGKDIEKRVRDIRDLSRDLSNNPLNTLRDLPKIEQAVRDSSTIKKELGSIEGTLRRYRAQIVRDRANILAAKDRDLARIRELKADKTLNGQSLSQLLVGKVHGQRVDQAIGWIRWMRKTFPHPKKAIKANRGRGETIHFPGIVEEPDFLVRNLRLNGYGTVDNSPYEFTGMVAGLTTQPQRYGKPAYLHLKSEGDIEFSLKGMIDRTTDLDHDRVIVHIPELRIEDQSLELDDSVRLQLAKTQLELRVRIDLVGDQLSGKIRAIQSGVAVDIDSNLDSRFATDLRTLLNEDLKSIRRFEITANVSGTTDSPKWELHSDLGPQLAKAFNSTISRGYAMKKQELTTKLNSETDKALARIANLLQTNESLVADFLRENTRDIFQLEERVGSLMKRTGLRFR